MACKRSKRHKVHRFHCPTCSGRLWRLGSPKHYLFYKDLSEITQQAGLAHKKAAFLAVKGDYVDRSSWLEEFFCGEHGKMWMAIRQDETGTLMAVPADERDWKRTTGTVNPNIPNPSVSEFTYRMSRRANGQLTYG